MSFSLDNPPPPPPDDLPAGWSCLQTATNLQYRDGTGQVNTMLPYQDSPFHSESGQMSSSNSAVAGQPAAQSGSPLPMLRPSDRELERPKTPTSLKRRLDPSIASIPPPPKKSPGAAEWTLSEKAIAELTSELQALKNGLQTLTVITKLFDNLKFLNAGLTGDLEKHDRMCVSFLHVREQFPLFSHS